MLRSIFIYCKRCSRHTCWHIRFGQFNLFTLFSFFFSFLLFICLRFFGVLGGWYVEDFLWSFNHQATARIKVVRTATQLERMRTVKPKMNISAKLLNTSGTVFEQGYLWELLLAPTPSGTFGPLRLCLWLYVFSIRQNFHSFTA